MKETICLFLFIKLLCFSTLVLISIFSDELILKSLGSWFLERVLLTSLFLLCILGLAYLAPRSNIFEDVELES